ncbi:hypothetical protein O3M35_002143 [Rhynocoris fuscipes]|uniref:Uncharacterized protein n=1 Tax=Rhynocoris fuscipes TaxID=488301 RepID=A0AAW1CSK3_9HEMI
MFYKFVILSCFVCLSFGEAVYEDNSIVNGTRHDPRFGFPLTYGTDLNGYSGGSYTPVKVELGGIFLGTLIGLGAVLLIPKLSQLFTPHPTHYTGAYYRNLPDSQQFMDTITNAISRLDSALRNHHIDSLQCLERAACTYAKSSAAEEEAMKQHENPLMKFAIDGTKLKTALDQGSSGENCSQLYPRCDFSKQMLISTITNAIIDNKL